jgi:hypothetical protein
VWTVDKKDLHRQRQQGGGAGGGGFATLPVRGETTSSAPSLGPSDVQILVRKVRNKAAGMVGNAVLEYDRPTGRYKVRDET